MSVTFFASSDSSLVNKLFSLPFLRLVESGLLRVSRSRPAYGSHRFSTSNDLKNGT